MKRHRCIVLAVALLGGCSATGGVSPGAVEESGGTTFVCDGKSCRVVADSGETREETGQGVVYTYTIIKPSCRVPKDDEDRPE